MPKDPQHIVTLSWHTPLRWVSNVPVLATLLALSCWAVDPHPLTGAGFVQQTTPSASKPSSPTALTVERIDDRLVVRVGTGTFTCYRFGQGQKYPYFYPVNGPVSGESLTTESGQPYPHHRSLFFGCDRVNGGNYWQEGNEQGQILSQGPAITLNGPEAIEFTELCRWRQPGRDSIIEESRKIRITAPKAGIRVIDFATTLVALVPIKIEKTNHSLFAARMRPELSVQGGGVLVNAEGGLAEKGTFGVASPWADYSGRLHGQAEGIAIFDSPGNPWFPSRWFTRDYGFFSPTPFNWLDDNGVRLRTGESLRFAYRTVVHGGDANAAGIAELYRQWAEK